MSETAYDFVKKALKADAKLRQIGSELLYPLVKELEAEVLDKILLGHPTMTRFENGELKVEVIGPNDYFADDISAT